VGSFGRGRRFGAPYESHGWVGYVVYFAVSGGVGGILWLVVERERGVLRVINPFADAAGANR